ncbi:membrane protein insertase YidC [Striga asiatica]|uniref:Membrane protein insertase YidC n=1 Tax=Striga asiatica TaxID=4170 RepID=A0A5A7PFX3_STRAF|nr:membrane protein insertase YidC [Striga asiatica]
MDGFGYSRWHFSEFYLIILRCIETVQNMKGRITKNVLSPMTRIAQQKSFLTFVIRTEIVVQLALPHRREQLSINLYRRLLLPRLHLHLQHSSRQALHIQTRLIQHHQKVAHDHKKVGPLFPPCPSMEIIPRAAHQGRDPPLLVLQPLDIRLTLAHEPDKRLPEPSHLVNPFHLSLEKRARLLEGPPKGIGGLDQTLAVDQCSFLHVAKLVAQPGHDLKPEGPVVLLRLVRRVAERKVLETIWAVGKEKWDINLQSC